MASAHSARSIDDLNDAQVSMDDVIVCLRDMHITSDAQPCRVTPSAGVTITVDSDWEGITTLDRTALIAAGAHSNSHGGGAIIWKWVEGTQGGPHVRWAKAAYPASGTIILRGYPEHATPVNAIFGEGVLVIHDLSLIHI